MAERGWTRVDQLRLGDQIPTSHGNLLTVQRIYLSGRIESVYNFGVDGFHTYFVGVVGAWVHNCNFEQLLRPNGQLIGKPGSNSKIRELDGGVKAAQELFEKLAKGGTPYPKPYEGIAYNLPDGGFVGFRTYSTRSGEAVVATIDTNIPGFENLIKLKFFK